MILYAIGSDINDRSLISQIWLDHVHHRQLVVLPHSVDDRVVLVEYSLAVELVLLESSLVALSVLEVLGAFAIEHAVVPVAFVFTVSAFSVEHPPSTLNSVSEVSFIPAAIWPPESTPPVSFSRLKLPFIDITFFASPSVHSSTLLFVKSELTYVVIPCCEVEFPVAFKLSIMELSVYNFMGVLEEADATTMWAIYLGLSDVDDFSIFEEFRGIEGGFSGQNSWWAVFDNQQLF